MPIQIEHEGEQKTFYTKAELDSEVAGLKVTLGQLKDEKSVLSTKLSESETAKLAAEEASATLSGDKEALQRISDEREAKSRTELDALKATIKNEKVSNLVNEVVTELGAGGAHNEDLRDLLKMRFDFGYDMDKHEHTVSGENVTNIDQLKSVVKESGRYDAYLAGTGSSGGDSQGSTNAGASSKKFNDYNSSELMAIKSSNPDEYERLRATRI